MLSMKLLLAFGLLTGIVAQQCEMGDLGITDFSDKITVTNLSSGADAFVGVKTNHGQINFGIPAGKARTAIALEATTYTVKVVGHTHVDVDLDAYKGQLLSLRSLLQDLTLDFLGAPGPARARPGTAVAGPVGPGTGQRFDDRAELRRQARQRGDDAGDGDVDRGR